MRAKSSDADEDEVEDETEVLVDESEFAALSLLRSFISFTSHAALV